ncbi:MAG: type IV pilus twitching motility protein PilT [Acidobacteria bacterium]|nr:type IV pilus twitching motility protein PilT [Acidobacteriota bacterium]
MAQLDQLIGALAQHGGEALVLQDGQKPALILKGTRRPIVNSALSAAQAARLVAEIAPASQRPSLASGKAVSFTYVSDGVTVAVDAPATGTVTITMAGENGSGTVAVPEQTAATQDAVGFSGTPRHMDQLFHLMVDAGASDLHMSSDAAPMLRVDGDLEPIPGASKLSADQVPALLKEITPAENWEEFERLNDTDFAYEISGLCRFRCNLFMDRKGPGGVFRVIPSKILTVDDLGLSGALRDLCLLNKGLVLVTGPTGSGKSTTLTALVDHINTIRTDHVITIEDPIEFVHEHRKCLINQREVGKHTEGFKQALRAALREDPDIVLVGEMRDLETVAIALETAETGHLVFGTLHTSSAISTVDRLIDQFPADQQEQIRVMLAESLKAIVAQVLCRKKEGGRVAALEVLMGIPAVSNLIREAKTFQLASIMQTGRKYGMITMNDALLKLVKDGVVEPKEAYMKALDKHNLITAFKSQEIPTDFLNNKEGEASA